MTFDDNDKWHIIRNGDICITPIYIKNILLVDGIKYNLLSINQFCDNNFKVNFESLICIISSFNNNSDIDMAISTMIDLDNLCMKNGQCLLIMDAKLVRLVDYYIID